MALADVIAAAFGNFSLLANSQKPSYNFQMFKIILLVLPLILLPGCARKTGSIQTGGNQPAFQLNGDNLRLNPQLLGITDMPAINLDTYSNGTVDVSIGAYQNQQRPDRGKAW